MAERVPWLICSYNGDQFDVPVMLCEAAAMAGRHDVVDAIASYLESGVAAKLLQGWEAWIGNVLPGVPNPQLQLMEHAAALKLLVGIGCRELG